MAREMKDSGIEWIGEIPDGWMAVKAKYILSANDSGVWGNDPAEDGNDKIVIRSTEQTIDGKWCIENPAVRNLSGVKFEGSRILPNDLLITKSSGSDLHIGKTTLADEYFIENECYFSNFIQRVRCQNYGPKLLWYLFNSPIVREQCVYLQNTTSGIGNINADVINNLYLPKAPFYEQHRIATFLDRKCAEIDSVIADTQKTIEEYKVLKQSIITEAVTKGVRGERKMKDSGVEWIGKIADGFQLTKLKYLCTILDQYRSPIAADQRSQKGEILYDYYGASGVIDKIDGYTIDDHVMLIGEDGANLRMRNLPLMYEVNGKVWINNHAHILKPTEKTDFYFLFFALECIDINVYITGSAQPKLSQDNLKQIWVPTPSYSEQREIAAYIREKCTAIDTLIAAKQQLLTELESYKKSVIYEYVTGKKEVL